MRFLVAGAAGFIGSEVARQLVARGDDVVGMDDLNDHNDPRLKQWRLDRLGATGRFEFQRLSLGDRKGVEALFAKHEFDGVYNLAARPGVRPSVSNPWIYYESNLIGVLNILDAARRADVPFHVLASTSSLYGMHNELPFSEDANTDRPLSPYAASKKAAEALCATYVHLHGISTPILRYFTVYGPGGRLDMSVFRFVRWIVEGEPLTLYGDGTQKRDYTYVEDIARGTIAAAAIKGYDVVNLGGDRPVTINDVIATIEKAAGKKADVTRKPSHRADMDATWADISKAARLLDWRPTVGIEDGLQRTVTWYLENREWARQLDIGDV